MDRTLDVYCFRLGANFQPKQCSKTNSIFVKLLENNFLGMSTFPLSMRKFKTYQIHALFGGCSKSGPCISFCFCLVMLSFCLILKTEGFHLFFLQLVKTFSFL